MTTNAEYQSRIQSYGRPQLLTLWDHIQRNETSDWEPGRALEYLVIRAFELEGAEVAYPFAVQMGGTIVEQIDGAVHTNGHRDDITYGLTQQFMGNGLFKKYWHSVKTGQSNYSLLQAGFS